MAFKLSAIHPVTPPLDPERPTLDQQTTAEEEDPQPLPSISLLANNVDENFEGPDLARPSRWLDIGFCSAFFLFGLLNNVLYVIIISAALDLVPSDIPTGVILVADVAPSLLVKIGWPYFLKGQIRYTRRVISCSALSFCGMMVIVIFPSVPLRLCGIALASISSGLGEMTFLQLTTTYGRRPGVSWFASGTGAAGIAGAGLWWLVRNLGVKVGLGLSSILPICLSLCYFLILPPPEQLTTPSDDRDGYAVLPYADELNAPPATATKPDLALSDKLRLAKPLLIPYMLPLFAVYFAEYTINTGIAPTLVYPLPHSHFHLVFSQVFKSLRDYYPFWQLTYQTFVFFSRSSMAIFQLPPLPKTLIPVPSLIQVLIFCIILLESSSQLLTKIFSLNWIYAVVFGMISLEGICGGLAYVSAYYWLGQEEEEKEFRMACVGFADTSGVLLASLFSSWLQPTLCDMQVSQGRMLCREVGLKH